MVLNYDVSVSLGMNKVNPLFGLSTCINLNIFKYILLLRHKQGIIISFFSEKKHVKRRKNSHGRKHMNQKTRGNHSIKSFYAMVDFRWSRTTKILKKFTPIVKEQN